MSTFQAKHAKALATLIAKGAQRVTFVRRVRTPDPTTGQLGAPTTQSVSGYALGKSDGDPDTYARLGLTKSGAPSMLVVCDTFGAVPMELGEFTFGSAPHVVRDVDPFAPGGSAILSTIVASRGAAS